MLKEDDRWSWICRQFFEHNSNNDWIIMFVLQCGYPECGSDISKMLRENLINQSIKISYVMYNFKRNANY